MHPHRLLRDVESGALAGRLTQAFVARGETPPAPLSVGYVRYKPDVGCLLGLAGPDGSPAGYLKLFADGGSETCFRKYRALTGGDGWVEHVPEDDAVLFRFPADRQVRALPFVADWARLKHILHDIVPGLGPDAVRIRGRKSTAHLIKYKPERRAIFRADLVTRDARTGAEGRRRLVVQVDGSDVGQHVADVMNHVRATVPGIRVPEAVAWDDERRILVQEWIAARDFTPELVGARAEEACAAAGRALRELQTAPPIAGLPDRSAASIDERCRRVLDDLAGLGDGFIARAGEDLRHALDRPDPRPEPTLVHGDYYYHQLLLPDDPSRDRCAVLDWDEAGIGDPRQDAASFIAHLHLRELEGALPADATGRLSATFLAEYGARSGDSPRTEGLRGAIARQLILLAMTPFRNLRPTWEIETARLLARAAEFAGAPREATR